MKHTLPKAYMDGTILTSSPVGGAYIFLKELLPRLSKNPALVVELISPAPLPSHEKVEGIKVKESTLTGGTWFPQGRIRSFLGQVKRTAEKKINAIKSSSNQNEINFSTYYMPVPGQPKRPELSVIYDMIIEKFPDGIDKTYRENFITLKKKCIERSRRFVAISHKTKEDLCHMMGIEESRVDVAHLAYDEKIFLPDSEKLFCETPYILYVGGRLNHKNFVRLAEAFALSPFKKDYILKVAGYAFSEEEKTLFKKLGITNRLEAEVKPSTEELADLYRKADCFIYPSLYEGFGLPMLEAMASGCAVVAANAGSLPEIGEGAALYFNPEDPKEMSKQIEKMLVPKTNREFIAKGLERVKCFSWDKTADAVAQSILKTAANS